MTYFAIPAQQRMLKWEKKKCLGRFISLFAVIICIAAWLWMDIYAIQEIKKIGFTNILLECSVFLVSNLFAFFLTRQSFAGLIGFWGKFDIHAEGLVIAYPFYKERIHSWDKIISIDICDACVEREFLPIIRVFFDQNVSKANKQMIESYFGNYKQVAVLAFSEERLNLIKQYFPKIQDMGDGNGCRKDIAAKKTSPS